MPHGSRGLEVVPLPPALCSFLQEFPGHEQKCLKPRTDWQSKMIHYSSLACEWVLQEWLMPWSSILMCCWWAYQDWSSVLGASLQWGSQWAQLCEGTEWLLGGRSTDHASWSCLISMGRSGNRNWSLQSPATQLFECILVSSLFCLSRGLTQVPALLGLQMTAAVRKNSRAVTGLTAV